MAKMEDAMAKIVRDTTAKSGILSLSMSSITTDVADDILKMADFSVVDGSAVDPAEEVSVSEDWKFDMGQYAREEDCYEPFFKHMVKYLNDVHAVNIQKDPPYPRGAGCCRLLDVHNLNKGLELEAELAGRTLRITGNLDAVFVPPRKGPMQYKDSSLGGVEVKHSTAPKETFKYGAPTVGTAKSGRSTIPGQALIEALAVYAYSDLPKGIFLFTSYDDNVVMELKDGEIWCWTKLNFAQAMDKIAAFLKGEDVRKFLEDSEKPARSRERPPISESKRSVRKKLKIGLGKEEFLEQVDVIRSAAGSKLEMVSDLFQLVESWRYCRAEACGSAGPLTYFS
jgi:hypothetical protein